MESVDQGLWNGFQARRTPWLDPVIVKVGYLGSFGVLAGVVLLTVLFLLGKRKAVTAGIVAATLGIGWLLVVILHSAIGRERPEVAYRPLEAPTGPYSFPSEHTLLAAGAYLAVALAFADLMPEAWMRRLLVGFAILLALAVAASRLLVGLCYPSDVAAGLLAGFCLATLLRSVVRQKPKSV